MSASLANLFDNIAVVWALEALKINERNGSAGRVNFVEIRAVGQGTDVVRWNIFHVGCQVGKQ